MDDPRLRQILESCYSAIAEGAEPELAQLCGDDIGLRQRIERMLSRERGLLAAYRPASPRASGRAGGVPMPRCIGEFTLLEPLGVGGMSHVYRARQEPLGREVALKVLRDEVVATEAGRLRFQREASITAALDHPNIVPVFAAGEADGHVYLAMKLLRGQPLDRCPSPMAPTRIATIGVEVASALQAAHDIGVVHRDIKPANIVIEKEVAYVVDFGLSSFTHSAGVLTKPDSTPGTLIYLAPELVRRRSSGLDPRVDVYGLGATLYEVLAGRPPFDPGNALRALHQILHHDPAPLGLRGRDRDLETIVQRAMDKSPQRRFQTADDMADELRRYLGGLPIQSRPLGVFSRAGRMIQRHRATAALLGLSTALVLVLGGVLWFQHHQRLERRAVATQRVRTAIDDGNVAAAEAGIAQLTREFGDSESADTLRQDMAVERSVQTLMAMLQGLTTHQDPQVLTSLVSHVGTATSDAAKTPRANATLAITSRLLDPNLLSHLPLTAAAQAALPRTSAALTAWTKREDPNLALQAAVKAGSDPLDHLFAALALRLARRPAHEVERELRLAHLQGSAGDAIRYSIAMSLEAQDRFQDAYDMQVQLVESSVYAAIASCGCARLAAHLGRSKDARRHLSEAMAIGARAAHLENTLVPTELEVLLETGDVDGFWRRWREVQPRFEHMPHYWRQAGYAVDLAEAPDGDNQKTARYYLERGMTCRKDLIYTGALEVALLHLDWHESDAAQSLDPLPIDDSTAAERRHLADLAARAEALAARAPDGGLARDVAAEALVIAAQAHRATGNRDRGWDLLEHTCDEFGEPLALARFAYQVGYRIAQTHIDGADEDAGSGPPLEAAAAKGLLRAQQVIARAAADTTVSADVVSQAQRGLFLCAFHLGEARFALPMALHLSNDPDMDQPLLELCHTAITDGGVPLDRLATMHADGPSGHLANSLLGACAELRKALDAGQLTAVQVQQTIARWRAHAALAATIASGDPTWTQLWAQVTVLEATLGAKR